MTYKIGFCCKWIDPTPPSNKKDAQLIVSKFNQRSTTLTHLRTMNQQEQFEKCWEIVQHNLDTLWRQLTWLSTQPIATRLFRITSGFLPASTLAEFSHFLESEQLDTLLRERLHGVRWFADTHHIRLCMHPGQFTNLCSPDGDIVKRAIEDIEYHAKLALYMGYGDNWHSSGFAINIHANANQDPKLTQIRHVIRTELSNHARNLITLENDEFSCSVDQFVNAGVHEDVALILDLHHHWIQSKGEHIGPQDPRAIAFRSSWRGMRALGHYSLPDSSLLVDLPGYSTGMRSDYQALVKLPGISSTKLRSHSFDCWNTDTNDWALEHLPFMDIEVEAKGKNIASRQLYEQAKLKQIVG